MYFGPGFLYPCRSDTRPIKTWSFFIPIHFLATLKVLDKPCSQRPHAKEEISSTPMFFTEGVIIPRSLENVREPSLDPRVDLSSRTEKNQSFDRQFSKPMLHCLDTAISAMENSFKDEEPIYVSLFYFTFGSDYHFTID